MSGEKKLAFDEVEGSHHQKYDTEISAENYSMPIDLSRKQSQVDAKGEIAIALPAKNKVSPTFHVLEDDDRRLDAGALLTMGLPKIDRVQHNIVLNSMGTGISDSVEAFFGSNLETGYEYNMNYSQRGCFVIFNHMHFEANLKMNSRSGTNEDKRNLEETAKKLGFEHIRSFDNLSKFEIIEWAGKIANANHLQYDCFAMAVLTHGEKGDILYARDAVYHLDELTDPFMAKNCPSLAGKPKLFFIQACRGTKLDHGAGLGDTVDAKVVPVSLTTEKERTIIPNAADFLLAFSSAPGYYAWRNQTAGSWFVQALCKCLQEFGDHLELMQILTRANRMVAYDFTSFCIQNKDFHGKKQIPSIVTRLTHEVFFRKKVINMEPNIVAFTFPSKSHTADSASAAKESMVKYPSCIQQTHLLTGGHSRKQETRELAITNISETTQKRVHDQSEAIVSTEEISEILSKPVPLLRKEHNQTAYPEINQVSAEAEKYGDGLSCNRNRLIGMKETHL